MVNGTIARACARSVGLALVLLGACGGKSVSVAGDDAGAGGTGVKAPSGGASSGGASPGTAPDGSGGAGATTGGLAGNAGGPSQQMLDDYCASICERGIALGCDGFDATCTTGCSRLGSVGMQTASCGRTLYDYFACVDALPDLCAVANYPDAACESGAEASIECINDYCRAHPDNTNCAAF